MAEASHTCGAAEDATSPSALPVATDFSTYFSEIFAEAEKQQIDPHGALRHDAHHFGERDAAGVISREQLLALSPLDSRYFTITQTLRKYFSSFAFIASRARIMAEWMVFICQCIRDVSGFHRFLPSVDPRSNREILEVDARFSVCDVMRVIEVERDTRHDIKAIEYVLREKLEKSGRSKWTPFLHFGATSEDVNNCAYALATKAAFNDVLGPAMTDIVALLQELAVTYAEVPLLARTHGQPATPTTFGKEMAVFCYRLREALSECERVRVAAKYNGATGSFNALAAAFVEIDWPTTAEHFITQRLGLDYLPYSTQVNACDWLASLCDAVSRFNTILIDLVVDLWLYISRELLKLKVETEEVGSSTMPHKINPIDFENAEGNLQLGNTLLRFFSAKLPISRLQRDLSSSTVLRNLGIGFGYCMVAYFSLTRGLNKITVDRCAMEIELDMHWEVLAEPLQTIMRKGGNKKAYEELKRLTRGRRVSKSDVHATIEACVQDNVRLKPEADTLRRLTPATYTGLAASLAKSVAEDPHAASAATKRP